MSYKHQSLVLSHKIFYKRWSLAIDWFKLYVIDIYRLNQKLFKIALTADDHLAIACSSLQPSTNLQLTIGKKLLLKPFTRAMHNYDYRILSIQIIRSYGNI